MGFWNIFPESAHNLFNAYPKLMQIPGMKTAFVSQVYSYMNDSPTILQLVVYWLASSSNGAIPGTLDIPQVSKLLTVLLLLFYKALVSRR
jgi:hypothetical protein